MLQFLKAALLHLSASIPLHFISYPTVVTPKYSPPLFYHLYVEYSTCPNGHPHPLLASSAPLAICLVYVFVSVSTTNT